MAKRNHPIVGTLRELVSRIDRDMPDNSTVRQLKAELTRLKDAAEALDRSNGSRNPLKTTEAHLVDVAKMARRFDSEVTGAVNRTAQLWAQSRQAIEDRITEKVNLKTNKYEMIVLQRFASMPEEDRLSTLSQMVKDNCGPELAAIFDAPPFLSGLAPQHIAALRAQMIETHASQEVAEIAGLDAAYEHITAASKASSGFVRELTDPNRLSQIEREAREAEEAAAGFDQTFQSAA